MFTEAKNSVPTRARYASSNLWF